MEENNKRNALRDAKLKLEKTRRKESYVAREEAKIFKDKMNMSQVELEEKRQM